MRSFAGTCEQQGLSGYWHHAPVAADGRLEPGMVLVQNTPSLSSLPERMTSFCTSRCHVKADVSVFEDEGTTHADKLGCSRISLARFTLQRIGQRTGTGDR